MSDLLAYQFYVADAKQYGLEEATMLANFKFWIRHNEANKKHYHKGRYWMYNSASAFVELFPFWTERQVERILKSLKDQNVILGDNFNNNAYDRTKWYAFTDKYLESIGKSTESAKNTTAKSLISAISPNGGMDSTKRGNGFHQTGKCNVTDTKPDQKPNTKLVDLISSKEKPSPEVVRNDLRTIVENNKPKWIQPFCDHIQDVCKDHGDCISKEDITRLVKDKASKAWKELFTEKAHQARQAGLDDYLAKDVTTIKSTQQKELEMERLQGALVDTKTRMLNRDEYKRHLRLLELYQSGATQIEIDAFINGESK